MLLSHTAVVPRTRYTKWQSLRAARPLLPRCMQRVLEGQLDMMGPLRYILAGFIGTCSPDKQQAARDVDYAVDVNGSLRRRDKVRGIAVLMGSDECFSPHTLRRPPAQAPR